MMRVLLLVSLLHLPSSLSRSSEEPPHHRQLQGLASAPGDFGAASSLGGGGGWNPEEDLGFGGTGGMGGVSNSIPKPLLTPKMKDANGFTTKYVLPGYLHSWQYVLSTDCSTYVVSRQLPANRTNTQGSNEA